MLFKFKAKGEMLSDGGDGQMKRWSELDDEIPDVAENRRGFGTR